MLNTVAPSKTAPVPTGLALPTIGWECAGRNTADTLKLLCEQLTPQRRVVHTGDTIYQAGERFGNLYILNSGFFKIVNLS
ncbi:CRP/FNR family transcriptional regulator, anaerobic regulatory protein, partial [Variovorax sp. YR634]